ncbi:MAG: hypothetical protein ABFC89_06485 [Methanospirillum sp.]
MDDPVAIKPRRRIIGVMQDEEPFPPVLEDVLAVPIPPVVIPLRVGDDSVELPHKPSVPEIAEAEDTVVSRDSPIPVVD